MQFEKKQGVMTDRGAGCRLENRALQTKQSFRQLLVDDVDERRRADEIRRFGSDERRRFDEIRRFDSVFWFVSMGLSVASGQLSSINTP